MDRPESIEKPKLQLNRQMRESANYLASQMPGSERNPCSPLDALDPDQIAYLQAYLEQVKIEKINKQARPTNLKYCTSIGDKVARTRALKEYASRCPINTWSNSVNYPEHPKPRDVQSSLPGTFRPAPDPACRTMLQGPGGMEFRNGFGPGTGIEHGFDTRPVASKSQGGIPRNRMTDLYDPENRGVPVPGARGAEPTRTGKKTTNEQDHAFPGCNIDRNFHNPYQYGGVENQLGSLYKPTYAGPYATQPDLLDEMGMSDAMYWEKFPGAIRNVNVESALMQKELTHGPGERKLTGKEINRFELLPFDPQDTRHIVWQDNMPRGGYPTRVDRLETY